MSINKKNFEDYDHRKVEEKWQFFWEKNNSFFTNLEDFNRPKKYVLSMFPYPSGSGLHVGHVRNYTIADASARFYRMLGFNVLFPIGWDSFGLPSEQYAIKTNKHPATFTNKNIENFKKQLKSLGFSYDWSKEISTSDPNYYSITQWMFGKIFSNNLAEYKNCPVLWCESLSTVLSNEEVKTVNGKMFSERGNFPVVNKNIDQWIIKITDYSKILSDQLDDLDWPISIKNLQKNWIGFTEGVKLSFQVVDKEIFLEVFTTRIDTVYGVNSLALSFKSKLCEDLVNGIYSKNLFDFKKKWENIVNNNYLNEIDGVFTGAYCINPFNGYKVPIWITNFVVESFGTGCLMISPSELGLLKSCIEHKNEFFTKKEAKQNFDIDYTFSSKFNLPITKIVSFKEKSQSYEYFNSGIINGFSDKKEAQKKLISFLVKNEVGCLSSSSHLKDWVFSRQRYWGEPIPVIHLKDGTKHLIPDSEFPLKLPYLDDFTPSREFYSPLQKLKDWVLFKKDGIEGFRDINVMPQWAGSCWYYIAFLILKKDSFGNSVYINPDKEEAKRIVNHWMPVDLYIGGQEHANLHLLYARFWNNFFNKEGVLSEREPFKKLLCQGMIVSDDGSKMSKSKGNIINPDYCIEKWGADSLRLYEMFVSPPSQTAYFKLSEIQPMRKWLNRVYNTFLKTITFEKKNIKNEKELDDIIFEIVKNYELLKFNLVVSKLMEFVNFLNAGHRSVFPFTYAKLFLQLLNPLAPHISEEIWEKINFENTRYYCLSNSIFNLEKITRKSYEKEKIKIIVRINNKFKKNIFISEKENKKEEIINLLKRDDLIPSNKEPLNIFFVEGKTINVLL